MGPEPQQQEGNGRKYRSKKQRPCDLCRSRKIQCKLQGNESACELCKRLDRRCTFILGPLRRKHRVQVQDQNGAVNRPETALLAADERHDESALNGGRQSGLNHGAIMNVDAAELWLSLNGTDQPFSPRAASSLLAMDWSTMEFPMGNVSADANRIHGYQQPDHEAAFMRHSLSPMSTMMRRQSLGSRPVEMTSESPSTGGEGDDTMSGDVVEGEIDTRLDARDGRRNSSQPLDWPEEFSLDSQKGYSNMLVGLSSEFDPYFLRHYMYNVHDTYRMFRLHIRKVVDDAQMPRHAYNESIGRPQPPAGNMPIQFVTVDEEILRDEVKFAEGLYSGSSTEKSDLELLNRLVPYDLGVRLVKLYSQFVHPRFPVLSLSDLSRMPDAESSLASPVGLRSAVYALAAPFSFLDDELSVSKGYLQVPTDELWAIAHRSFQRASRLAHLSLLQLCLLLHQMPPPNFVVAEPPGFWALSCSALAIAESLGLHLDPSEWRLPKKEIILRRRLWWLTYSAHTWQALVCSRPSHINDSNWDVSNPTIEDFEIDEREDPDVRESQRQQVLVCLAQCELSMILADILKEFYTLKANRESTTLSALLNRAQPLRARIEGWRQTLPLLSKPSSELTEDEFESGAALRLSHLTMEILIFRALLRPLLVQPGSTSETSREPISTIFENCYTCAKVATEIVSCLRAKHFASFWPPYVRYQLCYISTFILLNLAQSITPEMALRYKTLLGKWRDTLRIQARAWPLARLATMRLNAIYWKGLDTVVHGAGPESPAVMLFKEQGSRTSGEQ